jgi:hypothetical protein
MNIGELWGFLFRAIQGSWGKNNHDRCPKLSTRQRSEKLWRVESENGIVKKD